jgi:RNA polymerase-interacting CarD/CdnL/TRCF family regulator
MTFRVDDQVVHPSYGVGRVVGLVTKRFFEEEARHYYEISIERSTVWVPVDEQITGGLRRLTRKAELARYRKVLLSPPEPLNTDHHQRRQDLQIRLRQGTFQARCEMVRDLSARGWHQTLSEADSDALRKSRESLCQEWAAVDGVTVSDASTQIAALLAESRLTFEKQA